MRAQKEKPSLRYVIPDEGAALWVDYVAVPAASAQSELATRFIEFLLDPEIAALNANFLRYATPNQAALDRGLVVDKDDPQIYPPEALLAKLYVPRDCSGRPRTLSTSCWSSSCAAAEPACYGAHGDMSDTCDFPAFRSPAGDTVSAGGTGLPCLSSSSTTTAAGCKTSWATRGSSPTCAGAPATACA